ncbi:MAG: TonB-dependent receptor, partial [Proteobacteria bacterium]|nr:TonB-dependent receptor [Pseudomonadota bacterium]
MRWVAILLVSTVASAQPATTSGSIRGRAAPGTVVTVAAGRDVRTVRAGADGVFELDRLAPGDYDVTIGPPGSTTVRRVRVTALTVTTVDAPVELSPALTFTRDRRDLRDVPQPVAVAAAAPPTARGVADRYLVDGIDGELVDSTEAPTLPVELLDSVSVLRGGAPAAFGDGLGDPVAVVTRRGTNRFHGSVFGAITPGGLTAPRIIDAAPSQATVAITASDPSYATGFGADLGGPIVRDHAWFYVAIAPQLARTDHTREVRRRVDLDRDGEPDRDPVTDRLLLQTLDTSVRSTSRRVTPMLGKLDLAIPHHQGALSASYAPSRGVDPELLGDPSASYRRWGSTLDASARWTSMLLRDDALRIDAALTWHRRTDNAGALDPTFDRSPSHTVDDHEAITGCYDDFSVMQDDFPLVINCPTDGRGNDGGPGVLRGDRADRRAVHASA